MSVDLLVKKIIELLAENHLKISTSESCTGGMLAASIVNISGASKVFEEGYITYSDGAKSKVLGVDEEMLLKDGAVSEKIAGEMAIGCAKLTGADIALSTTGIAGPGGGTEDKPVGLVYIGCFFKGNLQISKNIFQGDRMSVRNQSVEKALEIALDVLLEMLKK